LWDSFTLGIRPFSGFICSWDSSVFEIHPLLGFVLAFGIHTTYGIRLFWDSFATGLVYTWDFPACWISPASGLSTPDSPVFGIPAAGTLNKPLYI